MPTRVHVYVLKYHGIDMHRRQKTNQLKKTLHSGGSQGMPAGRSGCHLRAAVCLAIAALMSVLARHARAVARQQRQLRGRKPPLRIVHWNVFEDGLNQAPLAIGLDAAFTTRLDALLAALGGAGDGAGDDGCTDGVADRRFMGFDKARDFTQVPAAVPIDSTARLLGFVDVVYSAFYHVMGGELHFDDDSGSGTDRGRGSAADSAGSMPLPPPPAPPHLRMALRTLFLRTEQTSDGVWHAPDFEYVRCCECALCTASHHLVHLQSRAELEQGTLLFLCSCFCGAG
jgi:hypothetical protein